MKLTKSELRKLVNEEVGKMREIDVSGRSAWDPANVKKREKEVRRLGKDKIAQLRRDAEEDQKDRAKSPRFKKLVNEEEAKEAELNKKVSVVDTDPDFMKGWFNEGKIRKSLLMKIIKEEFKGVLKEVEDDDDIPVFAGFGGEISPEELGSVHDEYEEEETKRKAEEEAKQQAAEKTFPKIEERFNKALSKLAVRDEEKQREIKDIILDELYDRWFGGNPRYWSELSEMPEKTREAIGEDLEEEEKEDWWERWIYDYIFIGTDWIKRYVKNWKEEPSKSNDDLTYLGDDPDFYEDFFKENKKMRITTKQLTRIIKEEVQSILKEEGRTPTIPEFIMSLTGAEGYKSSVDLEKQGRGEKDWLKFGIEDVMGQFYIPLSSADKKIADNIFYELIQQEESSENIATRTYVALLEYGLDINSMRFETIWLVLREILEFVETSSVGDAE